MKKIALSILMLCATWAVAAPPPSDYNVTVHVIASKSLAYPPEGYFRQYIKVIVDGKKYGLRSDNAGVLALGNYQAKFSERHRNSYDLDQTYEFLLPDGKTREFHLYSIPE